MTEATVNTSRPWAMLRWLLAIVTLSPLFAACDREAPPRPEVQMSVAFECRVMLIGVTAEACREDVIGPGLLTISIAPEPVEASWEIAVRGLKALAEVCEFHGSFDRKRLSGLQGRGAVELVCPIAPQVDRAYHELRFEHDEELPNRAVIVTARFERPVG